MDQSFDWDELLLLIDEQRVIPVVGKELMTLHLDNEDVLLERYIAERLAERLSVSLDQLSSQFDLNEVALQYLKNGGKDQKIYSTIKGILKAQPLPVPEPLIKLAAITDFRLYISLTFDSLLEEAINRQRFAGEPKTRSLVYSTSRSPEDLHSEPQQLDIPHVYHLFGIASTAKDFAITDEELLEYLHTLQSESKQPEKLFDALRDHHLLFVGCGFENWLQRFVVRCITNEPLVTSRSTTEFIADDQARSDPRLTLFLKQYGSEVFLPGDPVEFVDTLYDRWLEQHPSVMTPPTPTATPSKMESGAIFLSYASEDRGAVRNMKQALEKKGLDVWFDQGELNSGDAWDRKIQDNIRRCAVFLPFISRQAQQRLEGYFRREWKWAIDRDQGMDESLRFIQPVMLDDIPDGADHIPPHFWARQCSRFTEGQPTSEFVDHLVQLVRNRRMMEAGR